MKLATRPTAVFVAIWLAVLGTACSDPPCPKGYDKRGDTCYRIKDAGPEGGVPDDAGGDLEEDSSAVVTGDAGDESDAAGWLEAGASLERPEIQGAASMAPGRELWSWTVPAGTDHFELRIDDVAPESGEIQDEPRFSAPLELGDHTFKVRACRADQRCSEWALHTTRVESFGADLPRGLRDAARVVPATALGHRVAIGCNDCADGPNSEVYSLDQAAASIERALDRGADLIEINVASIAGVLHASSSDSSSAGARPLLVDLLRRERIASSDALLVLEVVENTPATDALAPAAFAEALLAVIEGAPSTARNGRPLWLRTNHATRGYLQALASEAKRHTVVGPYVRFIVGDPGTDPVSFYGAAGDAVVPGLDFLDAVSVDFRLSNLAFRLERARAAGSAVIVENVPGPGHGELVLGALREQADVVLTNYRIDQARTIIAKHDTAVSFAARDIALDGRALTIHGLSGGAVVSWQQELAGHIFADRWFTRAQLKTPEAILDSPTGEFFGPYLSFETDNSPPTALPVSYPETAQEQSAGFLFSFSGTLPELTTATTVIFGSWSPLSQAIVGMGMFEGALTGQLSPTPGESTVVNIDVPRQRVAGCMSKNQPFAGDLKVGVPHWIVFAYDPSVGLFVLVDGRCAANVWTSGIESQDFSANTVLGGGVLAQFYRGAIQNFEALRWEPATGDSEN